MDKELKRIDNTTEAHGGWAKKQAETKYMKPGSRDKLHKILITGQELKELKKFACSMAEAFGLDYRIEKYQGRRPIGFYRWDLDCLEDVIAMALDDNDEYPDKSGTGYEAIKNLYDRIKQIRKLAYEEIDNKSG